MSALHAAGRRVGAIPPWIDTTDPQTMRCLHCGWTHQARPTVQALLACLDHDCTRGETEPTFDDVPA